MSLTPEQIKMLEAPLDPALVKRKPTPGNPPYIPGFVAMEAANRIFGHGGWGYTIDRVERAEMPGGVLYTAWVTVQVAGCLPKQDVGTEVASATKDGKPPSPQAHETAVKGSVTDGVKRALRSYGDPFGLQLYDKDANVGAEYAAWREDSDPRKIQLRDAISAYAQSDAEGVLMVARKYGPVIGWDRATLEQAEAWLAGRARARSEQPASRPEVPTPGADTSPEPTDAELLAGAREVARIAVEKVMAKKGGPTLKDFDGLRAILSELQRLEPRMDDLPVADVPNTTLLTAIAKRLPAPVGAAAPQGTLVNEETPF